MENNSSTEDQIIKDRETAVQDKVSDFYEEQRYCLPFSKQWHDRNMKRMIGCISPVNLAGKILDNGCGIGILGDYLSGADIVGSDISGEMLKKAEGKIKELVLADSENLPFANNSFDVIFARSLLHHLPYPERGVDECYRTLKPGGQVVFQDTLMSIFSYLPRKIANWRGEHFSESHRNFRHQEIIDLVGEKFTIDKVMYSGYLAYLLGFPDIVDVSKFIPCKKITIPLLYWFDSVIEKIPLIKKQSWGIIIIGHKD
jgi:ubiquinone/menaquinone biosynthesis C-methylase UbiE